MPPLVWRRIPSLLLLVLFLAWPHITGANPLETYGYGSRAISMGGAYSAVSDDFAAAYYNPAGLPQIGDVDLGFGMTFFNTNFNTIQNVVVGETLGGEPIIGDVDTSLSDNGGFMGGVSVGLSEDIALGVGFYLPSTHYLARLQTQNQREPNFIWYEKRPKRFALLVSVGARVYKGLHIGAGIDVLFGPEGVVNVRVPVAGEGTVDLALTFRPRIAPYAGLLYKMKNDMSFAIVYKDRKNQGEIDINLNASLESQVLTIPIAGKMESMIFYSPRQVTFGWAWKPGQRFNLALDLAWLQWSQFKDATLDMFVAIGPGGTEVNFQEVLDPGFNDTLLPRVGIEYLAKKWSLFPLADRVELKLRGGYYFQKSPVPEQTGLTNFLDSDSHVFSAGLGFALRDLFGTTRALKLDFHFQFHQLMNREHKKDGEFADLDGDGIPETRVIGYPGYVTGGNIFAGGFTLGTSF
jgi:long-chain fatty acid transport protein